MTTKEQEMRQRLKDDFEFYARNCLKIRTKEGDVKPFILNKAQKYVLSKIEEQFNLKGYIRVIMSKGRQMGMTTLISGWSYWKVTHAFGLSVFILTHEEEATKNLFGMAKRFHENCPPQMRPTTKFSNAKELIFDKLDSGYRLGTAGNKGVGRSSTNQILHASEVAFWPHADEHAKGILQTVPLMPGTAVFIESTANGVGNWYHQQYQAAEAGTSDYMPLFIPWFWQDEYVREIPEDFSATPEELELKRFYNLTDEQICWRRLKITELATNGQNGEKAFQQEYPCTPNEAFVESGDDVFIPASIVMHARKCQPEPDRVGHYLVGVDPARFGDDRTAIIRRQGRVSFNLQTYIKRDTMEITGIVHNIIKNENPDAVMIDVGGLGAGIYDRLIELGHKGVVHAVNSASKSLYDDKYANKRAEMWALCKESFLDLPCKIPDSDELHADLCSPKYKPDSKGRLLIESKENMKKRGVRSSDTADALCLTFAMPPTLYDKSRRAEMEKKAASVMSGYNKILTDKKMRKN